MQTQTFNIVLPVPLARQADVVAKREYKSRSELIREALLAYLIKRQTWTKIFTIGRKAGKTMGIKSEEDADRIFFDFRHGKKM